MTVGRQVVRTLEPVLEGLAAAARLASDGVASVVWLAGPGDTCETCAAVARCPDRRTCLHRVAGAGEDLPGGAAIRVPAGDGPVGAALLPGDPAASTCDPAALGLADAGWLAGRGIRSAAVLPLEHGGRRIGAVAVLTAREPSGTGLRLLETTAALASQALGNASAYRELAVDRNRLAAKNARLRSGLGLAPEPEPPAAPGRIPADVTGPAAAPREVPANIPGPAPVPETIAASLPEAVPPSTPPPTPAITPDALAAIGAMLHAEAAAIFPVRPFAEVQREGILRALERTSWKVSGPNGAASLLGLKPTTLESKMKKLGIRRPLRQP